MTTNQTPVADVRSVPAPIAVTSTEPLAPLLVNIKGAGTLLSISERTVRRLCRTGRFPGPIRLSARPLWRVEELRAWVDAGCPARERWEADADGVRRPVHGLGGNRPFKRGKGASASARG